MKYINIYIYMKYIYICKSMKYIYVYIHIYSVYIYIHTLQTVNQKRIKVTVLISHKIDFKTNNH